MTGAELQQARNRLGVSGAAFARAFDVSERTLRGWEAGRRIIDGKPVPVPLTVAILTRLALKSASIRNELGLRTNPPSGPLSKKAHAQATP